METLKMRGVEQASLIKIRLKLNDLVIEMHDVARSMTEDKHQPVRGKTLREFAGKLSDLENDLRRLSFLD